ncbi:MAG: DUF1810 family protein, partial [Spirochaetales bacterium]|nr:DUF1810 family protein [Spirochaetales bacterium]
LALESNNASQIMGYPDDMKLKSCMTLFMLAAPEIPVFQAILDKFYGGEPDKKTIELIKD